MNYEIIISGLYLFILVLCYVRGEAIRENEYEAIIFLNILIVFLFILSIVLLDSNYVIKKDMSRVIAENNLTKKLKDKEAKELVKEYILDKYSQEKEKEIDKKLNLK